MQTGRFLLFLIIPACIAFGTACSGNSSGRDAVFAYRLSNEEKQLLQQGDIIMRHGYGFVSNTIVKTLAEPYALSHAGIIVIDDKGQIRVIHSVSQSISDFDGVQEVDLDTFVRDSQPNTLVVVRFRRFSEDTEYPQSVARRAHYYLEQKIPFDYSFSFADSTRFFCSELIARSLSDVFGTHILQSLYPPEMSSLEKLGFAGFLDPRKFEIIIDHQNNR